MKKYRLKKEAREFVLEKYSNSIYTLDIWNDAGIDIRALEEIKPVYITYGINDLDQGSSLSGWGGKKGAHFHFTIKFPSIKYSEYDKFSKGRELSKFMDKIQNMADNYFDDFINNELSK